MLLDTIRSVIAAPARGSRPSTFATFAVAVALVGSILGFRARQRILSPLTGTWTLVAADRIAPDGVRRPDYGANPHGQLIVDANGRYSVQIYSDDRARFASGDKAKGTLDEYTGAVLGMSTHFGTCSIDEAAGTLRFRIERSAFKNWEGTEQLRKYELHGDELSYQVPASASGNGSIAVSLWRRMP